MSGRKTLSQLFPNLNKKNGYFIGDAVEFEDGLLEVRLYLRNL